MFYIRVNNKWLVELNNRIMLTDQTSPTLFGSKELAEDFANSNISNVKFEIKAIPKNSDIHNVDKYRKREL